MKNSGKRGKEKEIGEVGERKGKSYILFLKECKNEIGLEGDRV